MTHEIEVEKEVEKTFDRLYIRLGIVIALLLVIGTVLEDCETQPKPQPTCNHLEIFRPLVTDSDTIPLQRATTYWCNESECDSNPFSTADGSIIDPLNPKRWVALSRDLLHRWGGEFHYGDTIEIYSKEHPNLDGLWVVHDCMSSKYEMSIDFLLSPDQNVPKLGVGKDCKIITCGE
jgi:hypothetical protein